MNKLPILLTAAADERDLEFEQFREASLRSPFRTIHSGKLRLIRSLRPIIQGFNMEIKSFLRVPSNGCTTIASRWVADAARPSTNVTNTSNKGSC